MLPASTMYDKVIQKKCTSASYVVAGDVFGRILEEVCTGGGFAATRANVGHIHPAPAISTSPSLENGAHFTRSIDGGLPRTDDGVGDLGHAPELVNTSNVTDSQTRLKRARTGIDIDRASSQNTCSDIACSGRDAHTLRTAQQAYPTPPSDAVDQPTVLIANTPSGLPSAGTYLNHGYGTQPYDEKSLLLPPFQNGAIASSSVKVGAKRVRLSSASKAGPSPSAKKSTHSTVGYFCKLPGCPTPNKAFSFLGVLKRHQNCLKEHSEVRFSCPLCTDRSFTRNDRLNAHIKKKHPNIT